MIEKVLCPYCGTEMFPTYNEGGVVKWACRCGAEAPVVVRKPEESFDDAAERARVLALRRYQPENRVLTADETESTLDAVWVEHKCSGRVELCIVSDPCKRPYECFSLNTRSWYGTRLRSKYGKVWRCWLRKPTEEERRWSGMADLIDRKKLLEVLDEYLRVSFLPTTEYLKGCHAGFETAIDFVEAAPAIDVEPVRHGRWENHPEPQYPTWAQWFEANFFVRKFDLMKPCVFTGEACSTNKTCHGCMAEPIPADIAKRLGIKPKEENE